MRILMASNYGYWGNFLPSDLREGNVQVGGGETAMMSIARELAGLGHEVIVFYDVAKPGQYDGVDYLPTNQAVSMICQFDHDVLVAWDNMHLFRFGDAAKVHVAAFQLNDAHIGIFDYVVDLYMHPSKWHAEMFHEIYPEMTEEKSLPRVTNGVDFVRYQQDVDERDPNRVIYSSSPDRGLHHLLRFWPRVREEVPEANLHVYYEIDKWLEMVLGNRQIMTPEMISRAETIKEAREEGIEGVTFHGGVGQMELARAQLMSAVQAYPCDPVRPTEGFSMTCLEALTAGCSLVTTDVDALGELWADAPDTTILPLEDDLWVDTIVKLLTERDNSERQPRKPLQYAWRTIAQQWQEELLRCLSQNSPNSSNSES